MANYRNYISHRNAVLDNNANNRLVRKYRKARIKWLIFILLAAGSILWFGLKTEHLNPTYDRGQDNKSSAGNGQGLIDEDQENTSDDKMPRDDYIYLENTPDIRVVLQAGNYQSLYHSRVDVMFPTGGYALVSRDNHWEKQEIEAGKHFTVGIGGEYDVDIRQGMLVALLPKEENSTFILNSIDRTRDTCSYYGRLEISLGQAGLLAINVLPLETYLCGVVPSEMPASYHEEALKAQAILARTYAYKYLIEPAYPDLNAHVDDSISFQVYGNIEHNINATKAVDDTKGILLFSDRSLAEVYYYSTSCGFGTDGTVWGGNGQAYLQGTRIGAGTLQSADGNVKGVEAEKLYLDNLKNEEVFRNMIANPFVDGYEKEEGWYRWNARAVEVDTDAILKRLKERYELKPDAILTKNKKGEYESKNIKNIGDIKSITIAERGAGGIAKSLIIEGSKNTYKVMLEYNIRYILNGVGTTVTKQDGTTAYCNSLLPSGFFYIDEVNLGDTLISYNLYGGGYGHGVGMSQNGANRMAQAGIKCDEILSRFFAGTEFVRYGSEG